MDIPSFLVESVTKAEENHGMACFVYPGINGLLSNRLPTLK
jgi:hypothetical protein